MPEQVFDLAFVGIVAKETFADRHGPMNKRCRDCTVNMAIVAQFWHWGNKEWLPGSLLLLVMTVGAVLPRLMCVPELLLGRLREPVEEEGHSLMMLDLIAAYDICDKRNQQY